MADVEENINDNLLDAALDTSKDDDPVLGDVGVDTAVDDSVDDPELEAIKARVKEMEEEAEKLKEMQKQVEESIMSPTSSSSSAAPLTLEERLEADARSVYVGNVDYSATAEELVQHFHGVGSVNRVTILCDKFTGHPKGFAYLEFADKATVETAVTLNDSLFKGRQIKVTPKRTNRPGISSTDRGFHRGRGRGSGRGFRGGYYGGYPSRPRGRAFFRGRGRSSMWYSPY